jgi:hypothetical protein
MLYDTPELQGQGLCHVGIILARPSLVLFPHRPSLDGKVTSESELVRLFARSCINNNEDICNSITRCPKNKPSFDSNKNNNKVFFFR